MHDSPSNLVDSGTLLAVRGGGDMSGAEFNFLAFFVVDSKVQRGRKKIDCQVRVRSVGSAEGSQTEDL